MKRPVTLYNFGVLALLLTWASGLNLNTNFTPDHAYEENSIAKNVTVEYNQRPKSDNSNEINFTEMGITLHPGSDYKPNSNGTTRSLNHCKSLVYRTLKSLPDQHVKPLKNLTLYFSDEGRRGLGGKDTIILRCQNVTDEELVGVLVHEMGHVVDTGLINGTKSSGESNFLDGKTPVYSNDDSLDYYTISWTNEETLKEKAEQDFVSLYGMTDPFEDFAESYAFYILHGEEFRELAKYNDALAEKYEYIKETVFQGKEYGDELEKKVDVLSRNYDVTVLPYDLGKFLII
ncbi:hypothetical protein GF340_04810 [Candidatus Peregrinibacteria bacterium]|nr:hypothetical protein [Candidatus Peregrinibacteria bacterium]